MKAQYPSRKRLAHGFSHTVKWALVLAASLLLPAALRAVDVVLLQNTLVESNALTFANGAQTGFGNIINGTSFQQFPLRTYRGYQYAIYYDDNRQVCLGRRKLPGGPWEVIRFTDYNITNQDTHKVAVLGICEKDGTIHLTFDHHVSNLHYRRSIIGVANDPEAFTWSPSLFGPVTDTLGPLGVITQVTYPRFISMPNGNLMLFYRFGTSGNGDGMIRVYNGTTSQWTTSLGRFIARDIGTYTFGGQTSQFRNAYMNGLGYAGDRLHASWVWRDRFAFTSVTNQHDLCYAYSDDDGQTWNNSGGTNICVTGTTKVINLNSPGLVVSPIDPGTGLANQTTQYVYPDGGVHVVLRRNIEGTSTESYHHHWRDPAGNWHFEVIPRTGSRPELIGDNQRNLFLIYNGADELRVLKGVPNAGFTAWNWSSPALIYRQGSPKPGGEPQIDLSRWHSERVLSIYNQEEPAIILDYGTNAPFDGLPTPMRVTDLQVSVLAAQPNPGHQALRVPLTNTLGWIAGLNAISNRVYFGTDSNAVATAGTGSPEYKGVQATTSYTPAGPLADGTAYYWRVDEVQAGSVVIPGLLWQFTTTATPVQTENFIWDAGHTNNGATIDAASGTWNKTTGNLVWNNAGQNKAWVDGTNALFASADGAYAITLATNVTATSLTFSSSGYTLSGDALGRILTLNGSLNIASNKTAQLGTNVTVQRAGQIRIGQDQKVASGTLNIGSGASLKATTTAGVLAIDGIGTTLDISGTLESEDRMHLGNQNTNGTDVALNLKNGGVARSLSNVWEVGYAASTIADPASVQGTIVIENGGTLESGSAFDKDLRLGQFGTGILTIKPGGTVKAGLIILGNGGNAVGILNLDGGVASLSQLNLNKLDSIANFNGGTLKATGTLVDFLKRNNGGNGTVNVRNGGVVIDSNGFDIGQVANFALTHSSIGSDNAIDGGLTKNGAGILTLNAANSYTGPTTVNGGTLVLVQPTLDTNSTVSVAKGAVLRLDFNTTNVVAGFMTNGVSLPAGVYNSGNLAPLIAGAGSLRVGSAGPSGPGTITNSLSGNTLTLTWPAGQSWRLVGQTNNLSTGLKTAANAWFPVPGGVDGSNSITINPGNPSVFYKLVYP